MVPVRSTRCRHAGRLGSRASFRRVFVPDAFQSAWNRVLRMPSPTLSEKCDCVANS